MIRWMIRNAGVTIGTVVCVWELFAMRTHRHTWTDHAEDRHLVRLVPAIVFGIWYVQHLGRAWHDGDHHCAKCRVKLG